MTMNPLPPDPYAALGVTKSATLQEIRSAHRKLVLKCHPDKVQDPTLKALKQDEFQKVQQAYEILSNEDERQKYDDLVKLDQLRKEAAARAYPMNSSAARTPPRTSAAHFNVNIRTAEPRPTTFSKSTTQPPPSASAKFYAQPAHPKSWDENIHAGTRVYEEPPRRTRRPSSYEEEPLPRREKERSKDKERRRRDEEALRQDREDQRRIAKKLAAKAEEDREQRRREEKEREKKEREASKKYADKKRRDEVEDRRYRNAYVEEFEDSYPPPKAEKKSSSRKHEAAVRERGPEVVRESKREKSKSRDELESELGPKHSTAFEYAQSYLKRSKGHSASTAQPPGLTRAHTFQDTTYTPYVPPEPVPTPPPAAVPVEDDTARRSSARSSGRRSSHDTPPKLSREKSSTSQKKSSLSREPAPMPVIVDEATPSSRMPPPFSKQHSAPPAAPESPPREPHISRSKTDYVRPVPGPAPGLARAQTWYPGEDRHERSRSRHVYSDEDSEDDKTYRRSRRTRSPEPVQRSNTYRYQVADGRAKPVVREAHHPDDVKAAYYDNGYGNSGTAYFKPKVGKSFTYDDVAYSGVAHAPTQESMYARAY